MSHAIRISVLLSCLGAVFTQTTTAQTSPTQATTSTEPPVSSAFQNTNHLETEVVTLTDYAAFPASITRKAGQFYLVLINKTRRTSANVALASTTAPPSGVSAAGQGFSFPFLQQRGARIVGVFNAGPGVYQLKSQASGQVLLTITIEPSAASQ